ncbi:AMP-binding protein, partial [Telmatospirillum sp.]|uniref:AMP-binding protein n=1 Tax=Telmatospirillum sp. TaxID=2079197 RepID=UPI002844469E
MASRYQEVYQSWRKDPQAFWAEAAKAVDWIKPPTIAFDPKAGVYGRWFPDGTLNTCYNAIDRHVKNGRSQQAAIIYDSPVTGFKRTYTYEQLLAEVNALASVLRDFGVVKGDRVLVYMPMIPEAIIGVMACARIGAIHSVVFGGFASKELATRINDSEPKIILTASCGIEPNRVVKYKPLLDEAIELAAVKPEKLLLLQRPQEEASMVAGRDFNWGDLVVAALAERRTVEPVEMAATDPLYILYTSGTTGIPKGVVRDNGGHAVAMCWTMKNLYGIKPGEVFWAASDVGWVVGHSYIIYGQLLYGA